MNPVPGIELLLVWLIVFAGAIVQSAVGFGLAVVVAPLLYLIDPAWVPGPIIMMGLLISLFTLRRIGIRLEMGILTPALIGRIPGGILGTWLLVVASTQWLGLGIGIIVLSAVFLTLAKWRVPLTNANLFGAGFVSGIFAAIAAIGGPPLALLLNNNQSAAQMRHTLSGFFVFSAALSLVLLAIAGKFGTSELVRGGLLIPPALLGFWLGDKIVQRVEPEQLKHATLLLCGLAGSLLMLQSSHQLVTF
ncbi:sulfite exporter TauE/SafE family protein [Ferrimonas pelagia]|uniref:Probable membrane transporter protein n=1 Tax=Ferrimonas pelagia TaxID=1177826 RepID=A0ABP9FGH2_9GAMM